MRTIILVFCFCVATVYGGAIPWTSEREWIAQRMFQGFCSGWKQNGESESGEISWHCKRSPFVTKELLLHRHNLRVKGRNMEQHVFIKTPPKYYNHDIQIAGQLNSNYKTEIYVVPPMDKKSSSDIKVTFVDSKLEKPSIFFLKDIPKEKTSRIHRPAAKIQKYSSIFFPEENMKKSFVTDNYSLQRYSSDVDSPFLLKDLKDKLNLIFSSDSRSSHKRVSSKPAHLSIFF